MPKDVNALEWVRTIVAVLIVLAAGAGAYSTLNSKISEMSVTQARALEDIKALDRYDVHLESEIDKLKGQAIKTEAEMGSVQRTTDKLEFTMSEMLKEMKRMNDILIRMEANDAKA